MSYLKMKKLESLSRHYEFKKFIKVHRQKMVSFLQISSKNSLKNLTKKEPKLKSYVRSTHAMMIKILITNVKFKPISNCTKIMLPILMISS